MATKWQGDPDAPRKTARVTAHIVVTNACNYRCTYCFLDPGDDRILVDETLADVLHWIKEHYGSWHFQMTGGEPLVHPGFPDLVGMIRDAGHSLNVVTNLSAPITLLERVACLAGPALYTLSASYHPEHVALERFVEKAEALLPRLQGDAHLIATAVLTDSTRHATEAFIERMHAAGIAVKLRARRMSGRSEMPAAELDLAPGRAQLLATRVHQGHTCLTGKRYLWIECDRRVYRCVNDVQEGRPPFGTFAVGFDPMPGPLPCPSFAECCIRPETRSLLFSGSAEAADP